MSIPQPFLQELLSRIDVVEVVGRYVPLRKAGANFMGLCPFHGEKSPSFSVSPSKQFFHCFGCGKSGNAIGFLMEHAGMGFVDAVEDLARQVGLSVPDDHVAPADKERAAAARQRQATLSETLEKAGQDYRKQLRQSPRAVEYLKGRGVSGEVAQRYGLGYAPEGWRHLASVFAQYDDPLLSDSGLVIVGEDDGKRYDRFRDRVMFPIRNVKGECIGFGGRVLGDDKPKYLNSPETSVFHKGSELYGLYEARAAIREAGFALVTEGYMDVVALAQLGFANAVATLGTACTAEHIAKLLRFTDSVVFSFDGDAAGRRAARKALDAAIPHAADTRSVKFLFLPSEHDPDSFVRAHGASAFSRHIADAMPLSRFLVEAAGEQCDLGTPEGRAHMASNARLLWEPLPDGALKRQLLGELATLAQLDPLDLQEVWEQAAVRGRPPAVPASRSTGDARRPARSEPGRSLPPSSSSGRRRRAAPAGRVDHAARLLLSHMEFLDTLSHEDNALLSAQDAPHGPLFAWIEAQFHEQGPLPWAVLRESLRGHSCEALAERVMTGAHAQTEGDTHELRLELRGLLNRMLAEQLRVQETEALAAASTDPAALQRYRALQARRVALERLAPQAS
ncbi:MAG: DNA primase [Simplicispira suum]|uniref:DNA primase n=1 Tax=Simplicispira suum TaxID=2109915 RepID=UPI001C6BF59A|nr:DNA primase [Simplicispira suum]MBW7831642.1 DNA primase [Simplicispira suum]